MLQFIEQNFGAVVNLAILVGGGLIMIGAFKKEMQQIQNTLKEHESSMGDIAHNFNQHLQQDLPHRSCPVEAARTSDIGQSVKELRRDVKRVEGWIMALAARQGVKEPMRNGDE
jgi:hypothetical protein